MKSSQDIIHNYPGAALRYCPASGKVTDFFGLSLNHILGEKQHNQTFDLHKLRDLIVKADRTSVLNKIELAIEKNESWNIEYRIHRNNQTLWLREQGYSLKINEIPVFDIFMQDVSEFKNMSRMLNRKLEKANQQAGVKNEFFASISHEIRTPMNAVMGMAQILAKTMLDTEQKQYVSTIIDSTLSLVQIINDVLDFSKLEAGKVEIIEEEFDLEKLCLDVCQLLMSNASEKQLALYLDFNAVRQRKVIGDKTRIRQILVNLIGNAIKFTPNGHVKLSVDYIEENIKNAGFKFCITDTGIGISKEAQSQLFQAFVQANAQIAKNFGGTGLGLRICQQLVAMMRGEIGVESVTDEGTTFWFTLPLQYQDSAPMDTSLLMAKKAIVVENDLAILDMISDTLLSWGVEVKAINDSEDTLAVLALSETYDFFVINRDLDGLDGIKLSALIKRDPRYDKVPVLMLTSIAKKDRKSEFGEAGITVFTSTPLSPSLLGHAVCHTITAVHEGGGVQYIGPDFLLGAAYQKHDSVNISGRVLIVDDIEVNRLILNSILSSMGLVTDFAENGKLAIEKIAKENYDMVFMDCRMPVMDGFDASRCIRKMGDLKANIPIVALTANASEQDKQQCFDAGMNDFLTKPFIEADLLRVLQHWMPDATVKVISATEKSIPQHNISEYINYSQWGKIAKLMDDEFEQFVLDAMKKFESYFMSLKDAFGAGDIRSVVERSHALKGMSSLLGAIKVSEIAAKIEQAGNEKQFEVINLNLAKLNAAVEDTNRIMMKQINPELDQAIILF